MSDDYPIDPMDSLDEPAAEELAAFGELLRSQAVWEELPAGLEDSIVAAIGTEVELSTPASTRRRPRWLTVVAAIVVAFGLGALVTQLGDGDPDKPAVTEFALSPTDLAGSATGTIELAELRNGLRIILAVDSLPPAPEGQFYEAWMRKADSGVSAGTFHMRGETGAIELWAGVLNDAYPIFSITLEDEDGDPSSSGRVVMKADLTQPTDG
jgi:hypothetical protein